MVIVTNKNSIMSHSYCFNFMSENLKDQVACKFLE